MIRKVLLTNAFAHSALASCSLIFVNSLFVEVVGAKNWAQLFIIVQLVTLIQLSIQFVYGARVTLRFYGVILVSTLLLSIALYSSRSSIPIVYLAGALLLSIELIGSITLKSQLPKILGSYEYKRLQPRLILFNLMGALTGAILILITSTNQSSAFFFTWAFLSVHLVCFAMIRKLIVKLKSSSPVGTAMKGVFKEAVSIWKNQNLWRNMFFLLVIVQSIRFLINNAFYRMGEQSFTEPGQLSSILSQIQIGVSVSIVLFQIFIARKIMRSNQPSFTLSIMPIGIIALSALALSFSNIYWPYMVLYIFFLIINKTIQAPSTMFCIFSAPAKIREKAYLLLSIGISIFMLTLGASFSVVASYVGVGIILLLISLLAILMLIPTGSVDYSFLLSLWKNFKFDADDSGDLEGGVPSTPLSEDHAINDWNFEVDDSDSLTASPRYIFNQQTMDQLQPYFDPQQSLSTLQETLEQLSPSQLTVFLLWGYLNFDDKERLASIVNKHTSLSKSSELANQLAAFHVANQIDSPELNDMKNYLVENFSEHPVIASHNLSLKIIDQWKDWHLDSLSKRKLTSFLFGHSDLLQSASWQSALQKLKNLESFEDKKAIIDILNDPKFYSELDLIHQSLNISTEKFNFNVLVGHFLQIPFQDSHKLQILLTYFKGHKAYTRVTEQIKLKTLLQRVYKSKSSLSKSPQDIDLFLKVLFLCEWSEIPAPHQKKILRSIKHFTTLKTTRLKNWLYLHSEFLSNSSHTPLKKLLKSPLYFETKNQVTVHAHHT